MSRACHQKTLPVVAGVLASVLLLSSNAAAQSCRAAVMELKNRAELKDLLRNDLASLEIVDFFDEIQRATAAAKAEADDAVEEQTEAGLQMSDNRPKQVSASSSLPGAVSLLDHADFATLLGLALDRDLIQSEQGVTTFNFSPFSLLALGRPEVIRDQVEYEKHDLLRRFGLKVSSGGKGEKLDQDGDGKVDDPLEAKALDDIVSAELVVRLWGDRDLRSKGNYLGVAGAQVEVEENGQKVQKSMLDLLDDRVQALESLAQRDAKGAKERRERLIDALFRAEGQLAESEKQAAGQAKAKLLAPDPQTQSLTFSGCALRSDFEAWLDGAGKADLEALRSRSDAFQTAFEAELDKVVKGPLLTAFYGVTERKDKFGPDSQKGGLRFEWKALTANAEVSRTESLLAGAKDIERRKIAAAYSWKVFDGPTAAKLVANPADASFSFSWENFKHDPMAEHDTITSASVKLELVVGKGIKVPLSITWADHVDQLTDQDEIRGHIGITYDLSALFKPEDSGTAKSLVAGAKRVRDEENK